MDNSTRDDLSETENELKDKIIEIKKCIETDNMELIETILNEATLLINKRNNEKKAGL